MDVLDLLFNFFFDWIKHAQGNCTRHSNLQNRNTIFSNGPSKPIIQRNRTSHKKPKSVNLLFFIFVVQYLKSVTAASCSFGIKEILFIAFWYIVCMFSVYLFFWCRFFFNRFFFLTWSWSEQRACAYDTRYDLYGNKNAWWKLQIIASKCVHVCVRKCVCSEWILVCFNRFGLWKEKKISTYTYLVLKCTCRCHVMRTPYFSEEAKQKRPNFHRVNVNGNKRLGCI